MDAASYEQMQDALILLKILIALRCRVSERTLEIAGGCRSRISKEVPGLKRLPVRWTAPACADLFEILEFVGADRPDAARRLGRELLSQSKALKNNALRGPMVPELLQQGITAYREILVSRYRMNYPLHTEAVQISAVIDASRDVGELLLQRLLR